MFWLELIIFILILSGLLAFFSVRLSDFLPTLTLTTVKASSLQDDMDLLLGKPVKNFMQKELTEIEYLLKTTGRDARFDLLKKSSILLFALGALLSLLLDNPFLVPVLGIGFAFIPIWYLRSTSMLYKKRLNEELETAISVITTSYLRSGDLLKAVKENLPYLNPPIKNHFEVFVTESEMLNANMISTIHSLKRKIPNRIHHEWCNTLIQCQSDRTMKNTLPFTVQKFSDVRIIQSELETITSEPKKEAFIMMFLVLLNIPLLYMINYAWFETLCFSIPGKITLAICAAILLYSFSKIMQLSKPIEYLA